MPDITDREIRAAVEGLLEPDPMLLTDDQIIEAIRVMDCILHHIDPDDDLLDPSLRQPDGVYDDPIDDGVALDCYNRAICAAQIAKLRR